MCSVAIDRSTPCLICHSNTAHEVAPANQLAKSYLMTMCYSALGGITANKPSFTVAGSEKMLLIYLSNIGNAQEAIVVMANASRIPDIPINIQMCFCFQSLTLKKFKIARPRLSVCLCVCLCVRLSIARHISETSETIAIKLDTVTTAVARMHHMLIILTLIQGHADLNNEIRNTQLFQELFK